MKKKNGMEALPKVVAAIIERDGKVLVARRRKDIRFGGLWEFPGGKLEDGEDPESGLERELLEELGIQVRIEGFFCSVPYRGPVLSIELLAYTVAHVSGELNPTDHDEVRWVEPAGLDESAFTEPDRPVVRLLKAGDARPGPGSPDPDG
ncbi:MAG: NUDIX domain-containing protein [Candidatus Aminicenantales bacterium]|jgi:8-oxo-dGTP diphosphatase